MSPFMPSDQQPPERPRYEPEIIPPDHVDQPWGRRDAAWETFGHGAGSHRVYVTRIGPVGIALIVLAVAAILAVVFIAAIGAVLIWIPIVAVLVVAASVLRLFRR